MTLAKVWDTLCFSHEACCALCRVSASPHSSRTRCDAFALIAFLIPAALDRRLRLIASKHEWVALHASNSRVVHWVAIGRGAEQGSRCIQSGRGKAG
eukprot:6185978-Pleurochrysis_carterae.AAC.3